MNDKIRMCCQIDCEQVATYGLHYGPGPEDNTDSCNDHVAELLGTEPLLGIEVLS